MSLGNYQSPYFMVHYRVVSDHAGQFAVENVLPSQQLQINRYVKFGKTAQGGSSGGENTHYVYPQPEVVAGETLKVQIGGVGRPIVGKLIRSNEFDSDPDWNFCVVKCEPKPTVYRPDFDKIFEKRPNFSLEPDVIKQKELEEAWKTTEEGQQYQAEFDRCVKQQDEYFKASSESRFRRRACAVEADGTFRLDDIEAGTWRLTAKLHNAPPPGQCGVDYQAIGMLQYEFSVEKIPGGVSDEPLDIGTLKLVRVARHDKTEKRIAVGEAVPDFELPRIDPSQKDGRSTKTLKLSDYRGKYVLLHFWATHVFGRTRESETVQKIHKKIAQDDRFVMIGVAMGLDGLNPANVVDCIARHKMTWPQCFDALGYSHMPTWFGTVLGSPAFIVVDPDGKARLIYPDATELEKWIEQLP